MVTFGDGGDVHFEGLCLNRAAVPVAPLAQAVVAFDGEAARLELPFNSAHMLRNTLAAYAAARLAGCRPEGPVDVTLSALRGERVRLPGDALLVNDCYNANPLSMRAALDDLAVQDPAGRRIAVLGDMLELGPDESPLPREIGAHAGRSGVDVLVTVGPLAAAMADCFPGEAHAVAHAAEAAALAAELVGPGDLVLVKASRGVGLEIVAEALLTRAGA